MSSSRAAVSSPSSASSVYSTHTDDLCTAILGATNPLNSPPGTIRGDYAIVSSQNYTHSVSTTLTT